MHARTTVFLAARTSRENVLARSTREVVPMILFAVLGALLLLLLNLLIASLVLNKACQLYRVKKPGLGYGMGMVVIVIVTCLLMCNLAPLLRLPPVLQPISIVIINSLVAGAIYADACGITLLRGAVIFWIQCCAIVTGTAAIVAPLLFLGIANWNWYDLSQ
jgi:hypothetical protein